MSDFPSFSDQTGGRIVYVRPMAKDQLPKIIREQVEGDGPVYAIHGSDGAILALAMNRGLAFAVARMNKLAPVSVH